MLYSSVIAKTRLSGRERLAEESWLCCFPEGCCGNLNHFKRIMGLSGGFLFPQRRLILSAVQSSMACPMLTPVCATGKSTGKMEKTQGKCKNR